MKYYRKHIVEIAVEGGEEDPVVKSVFERLLMRSDTIINVYIGSDLWLYDGHTLRTLVAPFNWYPTEHYDEEGRFQSRESGGDWV